MSPIVDFLVNFCLRKNIIAAESVDWFRYGVERRLTAVFVGIPFVIVAILISNPITALSFFLSFFFLRSRMNGYHAKTVTRCLVLSLVLEFVFLGILYRAVNSYVAWIVMVWVVGLSFTIAPYNHPNMQLTKAEMSACAKAARIRSLIIAVLLLVATLIGLDESVKGISLGCAMAGMLLCFAYIIDWRNHNGKIADEDGEGS